MEHPCYSCGDECDCGEEHAADCMACGVCADEGLDDDDEEED